ncbi:helix-turn-helix transcriptional regulator [Nonomuraea sp. NPDC050643]|uniref:helix-turn-helix domain-containing protein n=1 Tax=Nonomuraea sp. NPDC050643 TaxID=3155660 RepID=UPI0033F3CA44
MSRDDDARIALARRLRELRDSHWPDLRVTQAQLRDAFGVSVPLISSWESTHAVKIPPLHRLDKYAAFFASRRSVANGAARVLTPADMTSDEREEHDRLYTELTRLRQAALKFQIAAENTESTRSPDAFLEGPWHFPAGEPITIICSQVPAEERAKIPYASPESGDYIELYKYSDLDSLFELWGHVRAANPHSPVTLRATEDLRSDDLTTHLVLLGGVDYNEVTASMLERIELPVRQVADWEGEKGPYFEVAKGEETHRHHPEYSAGRRLLRDVAFFYRGVNPDNVERTLTICNGMYARGVYGVVRALTDSRFRDRNAAYLRSRFGAAPSYGILTQVRVEGRVVVTPDWTLDKFRLHEWPEPTHGD